MEGIDLEQIRKEDVDLMIIPAKGRNSAHDPSLEFKWLAQPLVLQTDTYWVKLYVVTSMLSRQTQIAMEIPDALKHYLKNLDQLFATRIQKSFPTLEYRPFLNDEYKYVYFKLQRCKGGNPMVDIETRDITGTGMITFYTHHHIQAVLNQKEMLAMIHFDVPMFYRHGNVISCNPRLLRIVHCMP